MADEGRKPGPDRDGRETNQIKTEEEEDDRRRPSPLHLGHDNSNNAGGSNPGGHSNGNGAASNEPNRNTGGSGNNGNTVTLPSFREAYGEFAAPAHYPPPHPGPPHHDQSGRPMPGPPRPYDDPNAHRPPGPPGPPGPHGPPGPPAPPGHHGGPPDPYAASRMHPHPHPDQGYREGYAQYGPPSHHYYSEHPPPPHAQYWPQQPMPPNYQNGPPETAPRQRTSIACKYCRKRKIRCSGYQNTPDGKCTNCKKTGNDCVFQPVSSTTSTAFVPVSAIQGGVPPGTQLYGSFGQPLGPNGGRGPNNPPANGPPSGGPMNGPGGHPGYGPTSPGAPPYYQHMPPPPMDRGPPYGPHPSSQGPPPPPPGRQLPLPYPPHQQPPHGGYPGDDQRARKRTREEEDAEFPNRLPPPPPYGGYPANPEMNYYRGAEDARRSPTSANGSASGPGSATSPSTNAPRGYGTPAPPVLPPPPMSSVGTDSTTSARSNGSVSGTTATPPTEHRGSRSPSGEVDAKHRFPPPDYYAFDFKAPGPNADREYDSRVLKRL